LAELGPENTVAPGAGLSQALRVAMATSPMTTSVGPLSRRDVVGAVGTVNEATLADRALDFR
jgi:hypothetical protein